MNAAHLSWPEQYMPISWHSTRQYSTPPEHISEGIVSSRGAMPRQQRLSNSPAEFQYIVVCTPSASRPLNRNGTPYREVPSSITQSAQLALKQCRPFFKCLCPLQSCLGYASPATTSQYLAAPHMG